MPDLVNVSLDLLIDGASGIWHQANEGDVSWSELARKAAAALGYAESGVDECATAALRLAAVRPAYSVLGTERGQRLPPLEDALGRFVSERAAGQRPSCPTVSNTLADNGNQEFGPYRDTAA